MSSWQKYLDAIRIKPAEAQAREPQERACAHAGCGRAGTHRAPKGREPGDGHLWFCLDHVREYNRSWNYFKGLDAREAERLKLDALTGHRPTWAMGARGGGARGMDDIRFRATKQTFGKDGVFEDVFGLFAGAGGDVHYDEKTKRVRIIHNAERKALTTLGLDETASADDIKAKYKALVKQNHPDANGGDRSFEDRLREVITAYDYLKSRGFC